MVTLNEIHEFLAPQKLAIAGASRNEKKFGGAILKELISKGFDVYPINPNAEEIQGKECFSSVDKVPADVKHLYIVTKKEETAAIVEQAVKAGVQRIWIQNGSQTPEAIKIAQDNGIPVISKKCLFMFIDPVGGIHGFHKFLSKTFGTYPKVVHLN